MAKPKPSKRDTIVFGRTPLGQLLYDLGFTQLSERYLARKHRLPVAKIRTLRAAALRGLGKKQRHGERTITA